MGRPRDSIPSYAAMHKRILADIGPARSFDCYCGSPALEWAYLGGDPDELVDVVRGAKYSMKLSYYEAMCGTCHRWYDSGGTDTLCKRGHPREGNTYWHNGEQGCKMCRNETSRKFYERNKA